jgi:rod shape-determining protein MreC
MESFFARHKNATILAVVLALQVLGLATQIRRPTESGPVRLIRYWAVNLITPLGRGFVHGQEWISGGWRDYFYLRGVRRENAELRQQIERMRLEQVRLEQDAAQARRLQALLQFKEQYISKTVAAQVIGSSGSDTSRLIYIDRGSRDGIAANMAVITPAGIVGKVLRVYPTTAQVLEITDQTSGVGAILVKSRLQGILKGQPSGDPHLAYIMSDETVTPGEDVITSGGDRIFPKGLPVGTIAAVSPGKDLFLNVRVTPAANLSRLEEVLVITKIEEREPDTKDLGPVRAADILAERLPSVPEKAAEPGSPGAPPASSPTGTVKPTTGAQAAATPAASAQPASTAAKTPASGANAAKPAAGTLATGTQGEKPKAAAKLAGSGGEAKPALATGPGANGSVTKPASQAAKTPATGSGAAKPGAEAAAADKPQPSEAPAKPSPSAPKTGAPGAAKSVSNGAPNASGGSAPAANDTP